MSNIMERESMNEQTGEIQVTRAAPGAGFLAMLSNSVEVLREKSNYIRFVNNQSKKLVENKALLNTFVDSDNNVLSNFVGPVNDEGAKENSALLTAPVYLSKNVKIWVEPVKGAGKAADYNEKVHLGSIPAELFFSRSKYSFKDEIILNNKWGNLIPGNPDKILVGRDQLSVLELRVFDYNGVKLTLKPLTYLIAENYLRCDALARAFSLGLKEQPDIASGVISHPIIISSTTGGGRNSAEKAPYHLLSVAQLKGNDISWVSEEIYNGFVKAEAARKKFIEEAPSEWFIEDDWVNGLCKKLDDRLENEASTGGGQPAPVVTAAATPLVEPVAEPVAKPVAKAAPKKKGKVRNHAPTSTEIRSIEDMFDN